MPVVSGGGVPPPLYHYEYSYNCILSMSYRTLDYWMSNKYTLRYTGGLVPDTRICQQFTKYECEWVLVGLYL